MSPRQQHMLALARANEMRLTRAAERRETFALPGYEGRDAVAVLLADPPEWLLTERIGRLLMWPSRVGTLVMHRFLVRASQELGPGWAIAEDKRVGELTERQRAVLIGVLQGDRDEIRLLDAEGKTHYQIANHLGIRLSSVRRALDPRAAELHEAWKR